MITNPWLNPFQRSYGQIKSTIKDYIKTNMTEITDFSEGNIFMILVGIFAAIAEVLHYYIDNMGREAFFSTSRRYSSLLKHAKLVDYKVKSANPASVDITVSLTSGEAITSAFTIPAGTIFKDSNSYEFISSKTVIWTKDSYGAVVPCFQKTLKSSISLGTMASEDSIITLGDLDNQYYVEGSMVLLSTLNGEETAWTLVDTFAYSTTDDYHYRVVLSNDKLPYIEFGDGQFGHKPKLNSSFTASFYTTYGEDGNVDEATITIAPDIITNISGQCTNLYKATAGYNYEDFDMIKDHLPLSVKTLGVAISADDYESIIKLIPGVSKAYINYVCGKRLTAYITPDNGGVASQALLEEVLLQVTKKKVITTLIDIKSTNECRICISMTITGNPSFKSTDISSQVKSALKTEYSYQKSDIARPIRLSDLYSLIDQLSMVDYLNITNLFIIPNPIQKGSTSSVLNFLFSVTSITDSKSYYIAIVEKNSTLVAELQYTTGVSTEVDLTIGTTDLTNITVDGMDWSIAIQEPTSGSYSAGDYWQIDLLPNNQDQTPSGYIIPVFEEKSNDVLSTINLTITEVV